MKRVISFVLKPNKNQQIILGCLTYASSKLWNIANYERKNWVKQKKELKNHFWYKNLPSQSAQEVLKQLNESWKSFYTLKKTGGVGNPKPPKFKHSKFNVRYLNKGFKCLENSIRLSIPKQLQNYLKERFSITDKFLNIACPKEIHGIPKIIEIIPQANKSYSINIIVDLPDVNLKADNSIYMSIDLGINNLMAAYLSTGETFIISGRQILSINNCFDKKTAYCQGILDSQQSAKGIQYPKKSKRVKQLYIKRAKQIDHVLHTATKRVMDIAEQYNVCKIIIGDITNIRDNKDLGNTTNQKFHKWPFKKISDKLTYKAEQQGIAIERQEESYTSQCSPHAEKVSKEYAVKSNRKHRGLYKEGAQIYNAEGVNSFK